MSGFLSHRLRRRRGTTAVEAALILPVFLTFLLGLFEYGHAQMVANLLKSACRNSARYGSTEGVSTAQATTRTQQVLGAAVNASAATILVKDAGVYDQTGATLPSTPTDFQNLPNIELSSATPRQMFLIRATVPYNSIAIMPLRFMNGVTLTGQAFMRHE